MSELTSPWLTTRQVAAYSQHHEDTVLLALRRGELKGVQRAAHCTWRIHREDVDRWLAGERPSRGTRRLRAS